MRNGGRCYSGGMWPQPGGSLMFLGAALPMRISQHNDDLPQHHHSHRAASNAAAAHALARHQCRVYARDRLLSQPLPLQQPQPSTRLLRPEAVPWRQHGGRECAALQPFLALASEWRRAESIHTATTATG